MAEERASYGSDKGRGEFMPKKEFERMISEMENHMKAAARELQFEKAAAIRDQMYELKTIYADSAKIHPWEKARLLAGDDR